MKWGLFSILQTDEKEQYLQAVDSLPSIGVTEISPESIFLPVFFISCSMKLKISVKYSLSINDEFVFEYYGASFKVEFGITDCGNERNKEGFKLTYIG